ncbi:hypothetical protein ACFQE5_01675 [Pseudonocardia hispaniensis]|uniref:FtsK domain-containing protein n=1 Tax=Pseudonocardia hispaniensis TaxID=904933 RepID=A0ABW1IWQ5_9PSEU
MGRRARREQQLRAAEIRAALAAEPEPPRPRATRTGRRLLWRGRRILAPLVLLAGLWLAGSLLSGESPVAVGVAAGVVAAGWWWMRLRHRLDRAVERAYAGALLGLGGGWLAWTAAAGVAATDQWLVLAGAVAAVPWWQHHWPRDGRDVSEPEIPATILELWEQHVADQGGPVAGAQLYEPGVTEHGRSWSVQLVPGRQPLARVLARLPEISQGLRQPIDRIVLEQHPDTNDPSIARLQIIDRSPIQDTVWFDRPRCEDGRLLLGPHADGIGEATWRLYTTNSIWGGFVLGGSGSGKSRLLEAMAVAARAMGHTLIIYLDGQDGASSPILAKHATWAGGPAEAQMILGALERGMAIRQKHNRVHELAGFTPGPELPGVLCIVDECHRIFDSRTAVRWAAVAREGRKIGVAVLAASQHSGLETFGHSEPLRSSLLAGNGVALRTVSKMAGHLIPGLELDPYELPVLPGFGYLVAAPGSGARTAPFRARYLPDAKDAAERELPVPTVEDWFTTTADAPLDEMTARAFGPDFTARHERAAALRAADLAEISGAQLVRAPAVVEAATTRDQVVTLLANGPMKRQDLIDQTGRSASAVKLALRELLEGRRVRRTDTHGVYELIAAQEGTTR